ncbi:MAG: metal-dependent hydrolase [Nanoarchaeota archaeon]|nr:metal-dependent hydrolase [Nanoarchaeota archaeon]
MPYAVTHVLVPLVIAELIRDYLVKDKKNFPLHLVLIAGIAGLLPDIDVFFSWIFNLTSVHRAFTHTFILPLLFLILAFVFRNVKIKYLVKHRLTLTNIFLMIFLGTFIHVLLDGILLGSITPLYPLFNFKFALNLVYLLPSAIQETFLPALDAVLLVAWLIHEELKHRISKFI